VPISFFPLKNRHHGRVKDDVDARNVEDARDERVHEIGHREKRVNPLYLMPWLDAEGVGVSSSVHSRSACMAMRRVGLGGGSQEYLQLERVPSILRYSPAETQSRKNTRFAYRYRKEHDPRYGERFSIGAIRRRSRERGEFVSGFSPSSFAIPAVIATPEDPCSGSFPATIFVVLF
jgi:hypothetical protein